MTDVLLLCDPEDSDSLSMLRWSLTRMEFFNPIILNSESNTLPDILTTFSALEVDIRLIPLRYVLKVFVSNVIIE